MPSELHAHLVSFTRRHTLPRLYGRQGLERLSSGRVLNGKVRCGLPSPIACPARGFLWRACTDFLRLKTLKRPREP